MEDHSTGRWAPVAPLTTIFTPPASCLSDLYAAYATATVTLGVFDKQPECYPTMYWDEYWANDVGYYSPGICPSGYTSACGRQTSNALGSGYTVGPSQINGETAVKCCPSNYVCHSTLEYYCSSKIATTTTATSISNGNTVIVTVGTGAAAHAFGIQVRYQSSDLTVLAALQTPVTSPSPTSPTISTLTRPTISGPINTESNTSTPVSATDSRSGLSQGAKIGIGVSIPLVLALFILVAFLFIRRRRMTTAAKNQSMPTDLPELLTTEVFPVPNFESHSKPPLHHASDAVYYKHPIDGTVEIGSTKPPETNLYNPMPCENSKGPNYYPMASPIAALPIAAEADSSQCLEAVATELPAEQEKPVGEADIARSPTFHQIQNETSNIELGTKEINAGDSRQINDEISYLEAQQERMRVKRERLKQLEEIDEEESRIQERLANLRKP